jgi:hypothetical protein
MWSWGIKKVLQKVRGDWDRGFRGLVQVGFRRMLSWV